MLPHIPWLSLMIWLPALGGVLVLLAGSTRYQCSDHGLRLIALVVSFLSICLCIPLCMGFDSSSVGMQFVENIAWIPQYGIRYHLGVDGISLPLMVLTCFTTLVVVLASWRMVQYKVAQYLAAFLLMQAMVIGVFVAIDSILFYFFWEAMLIPMYLSIGIWGGSNRSYAAIKFFIYTFVGSALLLVALIYLRLQSHSFNILSFYHLTLGMHVQYWLFVAFLLAFGIKVPMWPLHTWLPDAHTEAPAGGSVVLAALMLKIGTYGLLRFSLPIVPDACHALAWLMIVLSLIAIVYVGLIAIMQTDMKKLIAYSSVAHMGFVTLGCFMIYSIAASGGYLSMPDAYLALEGAMVQMVTHAFSSGALFLGFGLLYHQFQTRKIENFGGIAQVMPVFTAFFMLFAMSNVALPGTAGFVGEFMVLLSSLRASFWVTLAAASTLVIAAVYTLWMFKRVFYGAINHDQVAKLKDISGIELLVFILLAAAVVVVGLFPNPLLHMMHATTGHLLKLSLQSHL